MWKRLYILNNKTFYIAENQITEAFAKQNINYKLNIYSIQAFYWLHELKNNDINGTYLILCEVLVIDPSLMSYLLGAWVLTNTDDVQFSWLVDWWWSFLISDMPWAPAVSAEIRKEIVLRRLNLVKMLKTPQIILTACGQELLLYLSIKKFVVNQTLTFKIEQQTLATDHSRHSCSLASYLVLPLSRQVRVWVTSHMTLSIKT